MKTIDEIKFTPKQKEKLSLLKLTSIDDVLRYYPYRYVEYNEGSFSLWHEKEMIHVKVKIMSRPYTYSYQRKRSITKFKVLIDDEIMEVSVFNQPWFKGINEEEDAYIVGQYLGQRKIHLTSIYQGKKKSMKITPIYPLKDGVKNNEIMTLVKKVIEGALNDITETIPTVYKERYQLLSLQQAFLQIHQPQSMNQVQTSLRTLKYEEFLKFSLMMQLRKNELVSTGFKQAKQFDMSLIDKLIQGLSFKLTKDQHKVIQEVFEDLRSDKVMYRLIQGDVGSGKSIVGYMALVANAYAGYQGALMVPTEILAKQQHKALKDLLKETSFNVGILYSGMSHKEKTELLLKLKENEIDLLVGTHALFQDDVLFSNLGLVITDEQHRFGVNQRKRLKDKGQNVDFLLMSATPIPRTLSTTIYGDMEVSSIMAMPLNRKPVITKIITPNSLTVIEDELFEQLKENRQIYIVCNAIEKTQDHRRNVNDIYEQLKVSNFFKEYQLGLLHGKMDSNEKEAVMNDFLNHKIDVLICTTVIEVGVNVPNASVMVIYDASRFGLSQLHQLRGRVIRGEHQGYCFLLSNASDQDKKRLHILQDTTDGFEIAEKDLVLRGPGDILGSRQSGLPSLILGDLIKDQKMIQQTKLDAIEILNTQSQEHQTLIDELKQMNKENLQYID